MRDSIRIAFLSIPDPTDKLSWSGTPYHMVKALEQHCGDVIPVGPLHSRLEIWGSYYSKLSGMLTRRTYDYRRSMWMAKRYGDIAGRLLENERFDLIFSPSAAAIAYLNKAGKPVVYTSDTTYAAMSDYYSGFSRYSERSKSAANHVQKMALDNADALVYPSDWAAESACHDYGIRESKVSVLPYGANFTTAPGESRVLKRQKSGECRLLFLGVNWERKGGDIAFDTLNLLEELYGIKARLIVCGCQPPASIRHERLEVAGFLDKREEADNQRLMNYMWTSDYLLLPTRRECYGLVFCEASAFGLPSISTDTGGVSTIVQDGKNGFLLPEAAQGKDYAALIHEIETTAGEYEQLVKTTRSEYDRRLNWDVWGQSVARIIAPLVS